MRELHLKLDTANPTHSFKDRVVAVACAKAQELGLRRSRARRPGTSPARSRRGPPSKGSTPRCSAPPGSSARSCSPTAAYGATIYEVRGTYDDCSRLTVELSFELPWAFVNVGLRSYYAEGSKTLAFEVAEQLGWRLPDAVVCPVASGALFSKLGRGFGEFIELGLVEGAPPRLIGAQAEGCEPVAAAFREERPVTPVRPQTIASSLAIGNPADGDHARGGGARLRRLDPLGARGRDRREHGPARRDLGRLRRGGRRDLPRRAPRGARRGNASTADDCVVLLVTGDGLKTPGPVADRVASIEIEADADALLEQLAVAV